MADGELEFLMEILQKLEKSKRFLVIDAQDELQMLSNALPLLKAFLWDSTKKRLKGDSVREVAQLLREAIYKAQDIVDDFALQLITHGFQVSYRLLEERANFIYIASLFKAISMEVREIYSSQNLLDFASPNVGDGGPRPQEQEVKLITRHSNIVGFEDEVDAIIDHLMEERGELDVISVVGMPGLGKTTLVRKIFQHEAIECHFPTRFWVDISHEFNLRDVLLQVLKGITDLDMSGIADQDLAQAVRAYLEGGKFLLVIDAVWTIEAWNAIRKVLPKGNREGKVLITSHERNVGTHANPTRKPRNLRFLSPEESWELLQYEVFGELNKCPRELEGIGRNIARRCDGVPLAIRMAGRVIENTFSMTQQTGAVHDALDKVFTSIGSNYNMEQGRSEIIASSYNKLPDELRHCFLYLGVFPKGYEIPAWTLTILWIAEGFIQHKEGQSLEETAVDYLNDLVNRNLVMVEKTNLSGEVKTCRVHNVIREFCNSKAGTKELNLFQHIKRPKKGVFRPQVSKLRNHRRLCIHAHLSSFLSQKKLNCPVVRSLLCFPKEPIIPEPQDASIIAKVFPLLRVLEFKSFKFACFPLKSRRLLHLRYITLSVDTLDILPHAIYTFWNLQTLVIDTNSPTLKISSYIGYLPQLRHLKTTAAILLAVPEGTIGGRENLQTLTSLLPECCVKEVLNRAPCVKKFGIRGKLATLLEGDYSLASLNCLENLKMVNNLPGTSASEFPLCDLPQLNFFPASLKRLTLSATHLDWSHISTLGSINSLQVLKLKDNAFTGQNWNADGHGFRTLQVLLIATADFVSWEASSTDFPILRCLVLKNCTNLREIPTGLGKSLQKLSMDHVGKSAIECAKEIKRTRRSRLFELNIGPEPE